MKALAKRAFVASSRACFNLAYRAFKKPERENLAVFLSRQTNEPSYDYIELAHEFERRGWTCVMHLKKVRARNVVAYVFHVLKELKLLGRCRVAVLDRYDPVICLLDFDCDPAYAEVPRMPVKRRALGPCNLDFPVKPQVLQIWHAFGAFKKFGFQSVDTPEGHSTEFTDVYDIHRNYSWVLCSGKNARKAFSEAFSCPEERVIPLVRPEYDELRAARGERMRRKSESGGRFRVLMAPTRRINDDSAHPFRDLYAHRESIESAVEGEITWSFHPLDAGLPAPGNVSDNLLGADCVVTDYSSIVYEAYLLGIPCVFYVPDLEEYRVSPGLNADPDMLCPGLCVRVEDDLIAMINGISRDPSSYPDEQFSAFASSAFDFETDSLPGTAASRIVDFAIAESL